MDEEPLELELHGYVDGILDEELMARIESYLSKHPEAAAKVRAYLQQKNDLTACARAAGDSTPAARIDELEKRLARRLRRHNIFRWRSVAVMATLLAVGWAAHVLYLALAADPAHTDEIVQAHMLSTSVPEEIMSISPERMQSLFRRIDAIERLPDLRPIGFQPVGAQLLPSDAGLVLHVPYRDARGTTVSYFLLHAEQDEELPQHILHRNGVTLIYWQHHHSHYALAALMDDERIRRMASFIDAAPDNS